MNEYGGYDYDRDQADYVNDAWSHVGGNPESDEKSASRVRAVIEDTARQDTDEETLKL